MNQLQAERWSTSLGKVFWPGSRMIYFKKVISRLIVQTCSTKGVSYWRFLAQTPRWSALKGQVIESANRWLTERRSSCVLGSAWKMIGIKRLSIKRVLSVLVNENQLLCFCDSHATANISSPLKSTVFVLKYMYQRSCGWEYVTTVKLWNIIMSQFLFSGLL